MDGSSDNQIAGSDVGSPRTWNDVVLRKSRFIPNEGEPDTLLQRIAQQRFSGTPIVFNAKCGIFFFPTLLVLLITFGAVLWSAAAEKVSYSSKYGPTEHNGDKLGDGMARWNGNVSILNFTVTHRMEKPIHVKYHLSRFFQNHRSYRKSVSWAQLQGNKDDHLGTNCKLWHQDEKNRTWYPCGLIARSVFSDFFMVYKKERNETIWTKVPIVPDRIVDSSHPSWPTRTMDDVTETNYWIYFQFPPQRCVQKLPSDVIDALKAGFAKNIKQAYVATVNDTGQPDCEWGSGTSKCRFTLTRGTPGEFCGEGALQNFEEVQEHEFGVASPHFVNWFYLAASANFHKQWGIIEDDIPEGTELKVVIFDNFDVASFYGQKQFVITTTNWIGTDDYTFAIVYFSTSGFCVLASLYMTGIWVKRPKLKSPTALDDVKQGDETTSVLVVETVDA